MASPIQKCCSWFPCCKYEPEEALPQTTVYGTFPGPAQPNDVVAAAKPKPPDNEMVDIPLED